MIRTAGVAAHVYDATYYDYINAGSTRSAERVLPVVLRHFDVRSVVDFGSGEGAWLAVWRRLGISEVLGVDGEYVDRASLLVPPHMFIAADLSRPIRLGRVFDVVQSFEVAEHLPGSAAETFVDTLVAHGAVVVFSAAAPGQGGEHHVNEQPYEYWRGLFRRRGFVMLDLIRPAISGVASVEPWYRYNTFVFVREARMASMPAEVRRHRVSDRAAVADVSPAWYRLRKTLLKRLSIDAATRLAILKKHWHVQRARRLGHG